MEDEVIYESEGLIGRIILNKPRKKNTLDLVTLRKLINAFKKSAETGDICVIYTAEGDNFTYGADLKYGYKMITKPEMFIESIEYLASFQELTRTMLEHPGVIIAGLKGWAIGGGFEITLSCDLRIAANTTLIMLPELSMGLFFSNASTKLLPRIIGEGRAKHLMYMGETLEAEEALRIGLVNHVCKPEDLSGVLDGYAKSIVEKEHLALKLSKKIINENQERDINSVLDRELVAMIKTGQSEGLRKNIMAFVGKKEPKKQD
ncbi:MAG: enoyl-CoA hydratase/isomerase family protein [Candidatus Hodarchaeales archaeon]